MLKLALLALAFTAQAQPPVPLQWVDVTNHPGYQALGRINANGYVVDIAQWRRKGETDAPVPAQNFGVSLPSPTAGEHTWSNDLPFAESIERTIAQLGQSAKESAEAGPRPCPRPNPFPDDEPARDPPKVNFVPYLLAGLCVIGGLLVLLGVAFLTYFLTSPRTPHAPR